jgi:hypothetical protein
MNVPLTPIRCLYRAVDLYGKKTGVVCGSNSYTYAQFVERCERLASITINCWKVITGRPWFEPSPCL